MATKVNNFDKFVKSIQALKHSCKFEYEGQLYTDDPIKCILLHERYKTLCDVLTTASAYSENNVVISEE